jgi:hypothetical protein
MLIPNIKRTAAILLMICFVLPLSRCERHAKPEAAEAAQAKNAATSAPLIQSLPVRTYEDTYAYNSVSPDKGWESAITIATFFWPLLFFFTGRKSWGFNGAMTIGVLELVLCSASAYVVYGLVIFGELRYGGVLTFLALGIYSSAALVEISARLWPLLGPRSSARGTDSI